MSEAMSNQFGYTIRPAVESDIPLLLTFVRELADYEKLSDQVVADEGALRAAMFGDTRCGEAVIALVGDEPAGFAVFFQNFSTFLAKPGIYLEDLFVRTRFRRRGIGRGLLEYLAREANRRGCGRFEWAVLDWNKPAQEFYESMGATIIPDWRICRIAGESLEAFGK